MVFLTQSLKTGFKKLRGTYLDSAYIHVRGGTGGMGNPKYGGIGGKGGDVYLEAVAAEDLRIILKQFPEKQIYAGHGGNSKAKLLLGARGTDATLKVPCGVTAITEFKTVIGEVNKVGEKLLLAKGGVGGCPATNFCGMKGQKYNVSLQLSVTSDVSIVGFPNAGKSTFLRACSNAKPKVAAYPFTTLKPNVGIMKFPDGRGITLADLPGLIEGAHQNYGMGHKFLRHVERCRCIMMIVDVLGFQLSPDRPFRSAFETVMLLNQELELYNSDFLRKPISLVVNKMDLPNSEKLFSELKDMIENIDESLLKIPENMRPEMPIQFEDIIPISAQNGDDVERVRNHLRDVVDALADVNEEEVKQRLAKLRYENIEVGPSLV